LEDDPGFLFGAGLFSRATFVSRSVPYIDPMAPKSPHPSGLPASTREFTTNKYHRKHRVNPPPPESQSQDAHPKTNMTMEKQP